MRPYRHRSQLSKAQRRAALRRRQRRRQRMKPAPALTFTERVRKGIADLLALLD